jgi:protein-S-isoprenylcysteine O-methyltransferase Ste14
MAVPSSVTLHSLIVRYGNFLFRYRGSLFFGAYIALFAGFRPVALFGEWRLDYYFDLLGLFIAALGQTLRVAVIGLTYIIRGGNNRQVHAETLVTQGIFAHVRNPLYEGNLLIILGLFIIHNNPWVYLLGLAFFLSAYSAIVAAEEAFLTQKFGAEYDAYCERTGRWWPNFRGLRKTISAMQFNWRRVLVKDYSSSYTWMVAAVILMAYEEALAKNWGGAVPRLERLSGVLVLLTVFMLTIRYLKKNRILTDRIYRSIK